MTDEEKPGEWEQTHRRRRRLRLLRDYIPYWTRIPFLRVSTRWKIRRIRGEHEAETQRRLNARARDAQAMESDPEDRESDRVVHSQRVQVEDLQSALAEAETDWFVARALKQRIEKPFTEEDWEGESIWEPRRLKPEALRVLKDAVIKAERDAWRHRREWMAFIFAVLFGVVTTVSVFYNVLSSQRKLNEIQGNLNDTQSVLADTQARLNDAQRKLTDLTEQVRRREPTTGKRGMIPGAR